MNETTRVGWGGVGKVLLGAALVGGLSVTIGAGGCAVDANEGDTDSEATASGDDAISGSSAVDRAMEWVDAKLHYCQAPNGDRDYDSACTKYCSREKNKSWDPYRSDCSGLVSWAWKLPAPGRVTGEFAPFDNAVSHTISAIDLEPGDAVNNDEHVMLFRKWITKGKRAEFIEEPGCSVSQPYARTWASDVSINGSSIYVDYNGMSFHAIRYKNITQAPANGTGSGTLDGDVAGAPTAGHNADGRLEVFAVNSKGHLETSFQTAANGGWSPWYSLGGDLAGQPAVLDDDQGRIHAFVRGVDDKLYHARQNGPNDSFGDFTSMGGTLTGDPVAAKNSDNRLEVFSADAEKDIVHRWQKTADGTWSSGWTKLGDATAMGGLSNPTVVKAHNGKLWVFARGKDGAIYHAEETSSGWSAWASLGGEGSGVARAVRNQDGRLELFEIGSSGALRHRWENTPGGAWSSWASLKGDSTTFFASSDKDGSIVVFARDTKGEIARVEQKKANGSWNGWTSMGGAVKGAPTADRNKDGRLEVFFRDTKGEVDHRWEESANGW